MFDFASKCTVSCVSHFIFKFYVDIKSLLINATHISNMQCITNLPAFDRDTYKPWQTGRHGNFIKKKYIYNCSSLSISGNHLLT